ncbi:putative ORFan [Tupanvirus deep ocean]|uniref:ORFan n=2 Tax=Tupanvirus TaxID=2094720 RepID=A0AC62A898_9VIRU|nr:putative ORFan [Tupanvirus deep ocean]QKU33848.1 putative ORFan [Tupanvirus deep ocean]
MNMENISKTKITIQSFIDKFNILTREEKNYIYDHCDFPFTDKDPCGSDADLCVSLRGLLLEQKINLESFSKIPYIRYTMAHLLKRGEQLLSYLDNPVHDAWDGDTNSDFSDHSENEI